MQRFLLIALLGLIHLSASGQTDALKKLRLSFEKAAKDVSRIPELHEQLSAKKSNKEPIREGYAAVVETMMAEHAWNPFTKYSHFQRGKERLEQAILHDPGNAELRYLRFLVQTNCPAFLGYNRQIVSTIRSAIFHMG